MDPAALNEPKMGTGTAPKLHQNRDFSGFPKGKHFVTVYN
jgi:hypothetical protein